MRIALVVTGGVDESGRERVIPMLLWFIERIAAVHDLTVYALQYHERPCTYRLLGATVRDLGRPSGTVAQGAALTRALHRDGPFDVLHGYWALPGGLTAASAGRLLKVPVVVTLDSGELVAIDDIGYGAQRTRRQRSAVSLATALATRVTVCTDFMARMASALGIAVGRIPFGVDRRMFPTHAAAEGPPWRLVHVASLNPVKDQTTLLYALARLVARVPAVHLDIVGEDTLGGGMQRLACDLGVDRHVTFHGFRATCDVAAFYRRAHVHVLSSVHEAAGVVTLEAAVCGVPTVGTAVGHVSDWAPDRAVAVPVRDPDALAGAIESLLLDANRRRRIAAAARTWALEHDADWSATQFDALYKEVTATDGIQHRRAGATLRSR